MANQTGDPERRASLALLVVLLAAAALRLIGLDHQSYWIDEYASLVMAYDGLFSGFEKVRADVHPPLYFSLLHFWIRAFGDAEATVRLLSVLPSVLLVACVYRLGKKLYGTGSGLIAAILSATSLLQIYYAQEARSYAWLMLFVVLSYDALLRWQIAGRPKHLVLYAIFTTAILYTHYFGLFVVAAQAIYVLFVAISGYRRGRWGGWALALVAVALCASFWVPSFLDQFGRVQQNFWIGKPASNALLMVPTLFASWWGPWSGNSAGGAWAAPLGATIFAFFAIALTAGAVGRSRSSAQNHGSVPVWEATLMLSVWLFVPTIVALQLSAMDIEVFSYRNTLVSAPALLLIAAAVCARLRQPVARALLLAALVAPSLAQMPRYYEDLHKDHWRQAAAYVAPDFNPDTDAFVFDAPFVRQVFHFYAALPRYRVIPLSPEDTFSDNRIWLVRAYAGPRSRSPEIMTEWGYDQSARWEGKNVEVFLFTRQTPSATAPAE